MVDEEMPLESENNRESENTLESENNPANSTSSDDDITSQRKRKVTVIDGRFMERDVIRGLTADIKEGVMGARDFEWPTFHKVPKDIKDRLWSSFLDKHCWDNLTPMEMRKVWNKNASARFSDLIYKAKQKALKKAKNELHREPVTLDMRGRGPKWIRGLAWNGLVSYWSLPQYEQKSATARKSRMTEKDGSITKHTGGSIPHAAHRPRLKAELGRNVNEFDVFHRTHRKNQGHGEFVDNKSKRVSEQYIEKTGWSNTSTGQSFDFWAWYGVTGGRKGGRSYGVSGQCIERSAGCDFEFNYLPEELEGAYDARFKLERELTNMMDGYGKLQQALKNSQKREEESRKAVEELQGIIRKQSEQIAQYDRGSGR